MKYLTRLTGKIIVFITTFPWLFYFYVLCKGKITGIHNIPQKPCILAFNHVSYLDWIITYSIFLIIHRKKIYFIGKSKLLENTLWKFYLLGSDTLIIDYSSLDSVKNVLLTVKNFLAKGKMIGIFPEGTRSPDGKLQKAEDGMAHIIISTGAPVVPVNLNGFFEAWPKDKKYPRLANCTITIGEAISFDNTSNLNIRQFKSHITKTVMERIALLRENNPNSGTKHFQS